MQRNPDPTAAQSASLVQIVVQIPGAERGVGQLVACA
jgi:hypothetical protein